MSGMTELARAIVGSGYAPRSSEHLATVLRRDSQGVYWVRIPGGADETPITTPMVEASDGDTVRVSISGGRSVMTGNVTSPASTTRSVAKVGGIANRALTTAYTESARIDRLETTTLTADSAVITDLQADTAKVHSLSADQLSATVGYVGTLTSGNVTAAELVADHGFVDDLTANSVTAGQINAAAGYVNTLVSSNVTAAELAADHATVGSLDAQQISADHAIVGNLSTTYAQIDAANITQSATKDAWIDKLLVQTGLLANDADIFTLDAVQVNAANITAGTLDVERLVVTDSTTGEKHLVTWDSSTQSYVSAKLDGDVLEDHTIAADKLVAHSITASEITTQNLQGTNGWINLAAGTFSYGNTALGEGISWDGSHLVINAQSITLGASDVATSITNLEGRQTAYSATCPTGATTAAKVVACTNFPALAAGATVTVRFSAANTSTGAITLDVNSTGAKTVYVNGAATAAGNQMLWAANANVTFTYDGTYWRVVSEPRTWYGTCATAAGTAAKAATINEIVVCKGTVVKLNMTYENTSTSATMNLTSTGAKNLYYGTTTTRPTTANGYGWGAASTATFVFDGQYWRVGDTSALSRLIQAETTISSHTTSINQNAEAIALKASQSDLDTLSGRVTTAEGAITTQAGQIALKANASDVYTQTEADALLEVKANKATLTSEINASADTVKIQASKVEIDGAATFNAIKSQADAAYDAKGAAAAVQTSLDNIEVGGRNLLLNTSSEWSDWVTPTANVNNQTEYWYVTDTSKLLEWAMAGTAMSFSFEIEFSGVTASSSGSFRIYSQDCYKSAQNAVIGSSNNAGWNGSGVNTMYGAMYLNEAPADGVYTFTNSSTIAGDGTTYYGIQFSTRADYWASGKYRIRCTKLEKGNVATDWTPAPEDMASASTGVYYATCSTEAGTAVKVATTEQSGFTLVPGAMVNVKFTATNSAAVANLKLNVDGTGDKPIKYIYNNSLNNLPGVGYLLANNVYTFRYDGTNWVVQLMYNTDTQNRTRWQNVILAAAAITSGHIICGTASGYKDIAAGVTFDLSYPLLYCATTKAAGETSDNNFLQINGINVTNNGTVTSAANYKTVYLVGAVSGNTFTVNASPFMTTVEPTSEDGFLYIPLGMFYNSTTNIYFNSSKDLYAYLDGAFRQVDSSTVIATQRIYIQAESATSTVTAPTEWVTNLGESVEGGTAEWTAKYPTYNSSFPVTFAAEQRLRLDKTAVCSDPVKDDVTTVIDGDHIVTGTIDATKVNVVNLDAGNITAGTLSADRISGGAITLGQLAADARNAIANAATTATGYMSYDNGTLTIGAEANETKAQLTNTKFAFVGNGTELAYMGQNPDTDAWETVIDNARISDMLFFGDFAWIKRSNGNMSLKWVG